MRRPPISALLVIASATAVTGCKAVPQIAGVVGGAVAGGSTGSPAIGFAVGVATATATGAAQRWYGRSREHAEQMAIAKVGGGLPVGGRAPWSIHHLIPLGDEHGDLVVISNISNRLAECRSIAFSVVEDTTSRWYSADICRRLLGWQWASAEPAVRRWGYLQ